VALLVVQALPWGMRLARGGDLLITPKRVLGVVIVLVVFATGGAFAAYVVGGATKPKHAIAYGLSWQSILGGFLQLRPGEQPPGSA
jgi:hypothetical protein